MYDTLIIGAGPTGNYIAAQLARFGHRVMVIERQVRFGKSTCCTGIVGKECLNTFSIGREAVVNEARSATFFAPSGKSLELSRPDTQAYILDRKIFDDYLARHAQAQGVEYLMNTRVNDIQTSSTGVRVAAASNGRKVVLEGKCAVLACGFGSNLPVGSRSGKEGDFVMGAQAEVALSDDRGVEVYFGNSVAPGFFAWLVPTIAGQGLAGLMTRSHTSLHMQEFLHSLQASGRIGSQQGEVKFGGIPLKPLRRTSGKRILYVGDAAGQVKPTTGGGIYYGLTCARIAVDVLHRAISRNEFSSRTMSRYDRRWKRLLLRELRMGHRARWLFERLDDHQIERLFDLARARQIDRWMQHYDGFSFDGHGQLLLAIARYLGPFGCFSAVRTLSTGWLRPR